jgi:hypothetical protein
VMKRHGDPMSVGCGYCGVEPGVRCTLTLAPDLAPLSVDWHHGARDEEARRG